MFVFNLSLRQTGNGDKAPRRSILAAVACAQLLIAPLAQTAEIPLEQAIDQAIDAAQIGSLSEILRRETEGNRNAASSLPNPTLFYEHETLGGVGGVPDSRETTFGVAAPLDFIWKRGARIKTAEARSEFASLQLEEQRRQLAIDVAILFAHYAANRLERERHEAAHVALDRARAVANAAVDSGDAPPTLLQRVELAIARHAFEENRLDTESIAIRAGFSALLADDAASPDLDSIPIEAPAFASETEAEQAAIANRPDLKAAKALVAWTQAGLKTAQREALPEVSLQAARKDDDIGRDGVFLGISVELPIFERNAAAANAAQADAMRAEIAYEQARRLVAAEARSAFLSWQKLHENCQRMVANVRSTQNAESLLAATEASFEAGESSLLEYLDTVEAYLEAAEQEIDLQEALRIAAFNLAHATATPIGN